MAIEDCVEIEGFKTFKGCDNIKYTDYFHSVHYCTLKSWSEHGQTSEMFLFISDEWNNLPASLINCTTYGRIIMPRPGALSDDAVWRLPRTSGRRTACAAGRLDGASPSPSPFISFKNAVIHWRIGWSGPARPAWSRLPLQAWTGAYRGGCPPTACLQKEDLLFYGLGIWISSVSSFFPLGKWVAG